MHFVPLSILLCLYKLITYFANVPLQEVVEDKAMSSGLS